MLQTLKKRIATFNQILKELPEVRYLGDPILRQPAESVSVVEGKKIGEQLGAALKQYREIAGYGRGLAAPQIGIKKAVFVTFVDEEVQIFINPVITKKSSETNLYRELCLSAGVMAADVERPEWVVMSWVDAEGDKHEEKVEGFLARLYQHEEAHLRGVVHLDEAVPQGIEFATFDPLKEELRRK